MTIYIDSDYRCHVSDGEGRRAFDVEFFDNKCSALVEGYRYVPADETWTRSDGVIFSGEMVSAWKDYSVLEIAQAAYDEAQAESADMRAALAVLGVTDETEETT